MVGVLLIGAAVATAFLAAASLRTPSLVTALLAAYLAFVANLGLVTWALSPLRAVTRGGLAVAEALLLAAALAVWWRRGRPGLPPGAARRRLQLAPARDVLARRVRVDHLAERPRRGVVPDRRRLPVARQRSVRAGARGSRGGTRARRQADDRARPARAARARALARTARHAGRHRRRGSVVRNRRSLRLRAEPRQHGSRARPPRHAHRHAGVRAASASEPSRDRCRCALRDARPLGALRSPDPAALDRGYGRCDAHG